MSMVFRAADEPAASRPDYWRHVICERFRPMEVRFADGPGSHDELLTGVMGALRVTESTSSAGEVHRTSKHVSSSAPEMYQLVAQLARGLGDDDAAGAAQLGTAVLDLLTVMLAARIRQPGPVPPPARKRALLASVHAFAEEHPGDPGLSPGVIAAAHHISGPA